MRTYWRGADRMTETEHAQWIKQFWKDKLDELKGVNRMSNEYLDIAIEKVIKQEISKVLGQIRDEVKKMPRWKINQEEVLQIIDRYKAESEEG